MPKAVYIAEKPSVAREFAKALKVDGRNRDGYVGIGKCHCNLVRRAFGHYELSGNL